MLPKILLATDCGSTTTKARLFRKIGDGYRFVYAGEAPTTVEAPYEDVTLGVRNAVREVEELTGFELLDEEGVKLRSSYEGGGVDVYVTTSSAGGGLQMMVFGATSSISSESAQRVALGAGAIVMDVISIRDKVPLYKKIERTRFLRPDMMLIAGGTDGGSITSPVQAAEILKAAEPKARFGGAFTLPVIFAGNKDAREDIKVTLGDKFALAITDNIRPQVELENADPARAKIQELFMEHVMSHAPGYDKLIKWTGVPIMPTPLAEGMIFQLLAKIRRVNVIGVGLGGATTNVYSIFDRKFVRTVSANLGMSYSICNVLKEAGAKNIIQWVPFDIDEDFLVDVLKNKMIRPTTIPQTLDELIIEHAVAREALRLGLWHHKFLARGLRGVARIRDISDIFTYKAYLETYIDMIRIDIIGGTGGLISHAPRRVQSALIMIDGFQPEGVTELVQDSVFMFPHLGVLSTVYPDIAYEIFDKDALVRLGTCVAPRGVVKKKGERMLKMELKIPDGSVRTEILNSGEIKLIPIEVGEFVEAKISPSKNYDIGAGPGRTRTAKLRGGVVGIIIDGRGRPLTLPQDDAERKRTLINWFTALGVYPKKALKRYAEAS